jgi:hypothetical protein
MIYTVCICRNAPKMANIIVPNNVAPDRQVSAGV